MPGLQVKFHMLSPHPPRPPEVTNKVIEPFRRSAKKTWTQSLHHVPSSPKASTLLCLCSAQERRWYQLWLLLRDVFPNPWLWSALGHVTPTAALQQNLQEQLPLKIQLPHLNLSTGISKLPLSCVERANWKTRRPITETPKTMLAAEAAPPVRAAPPAYFMLVMRSIEDSSKPGSQDRQKCRLKMCMQILWHDDHAKKIQHICTQCILRTNYLK